jgi:hypothetical protein
MPSCENPKCEWRSVKPFLLEHGFAAALLGDFGDNCAKTVRFGKSTWRLGNQVALRKFLLCQNCLSQLTRLGVKYNLGHKVL